MKLIKRTITQENKKVILDEHFKLTEKIILTEAQATLKQLVIDLNKLETLTPDLINQLEGSNNLEIDDNIDKYCKSILDLLTKKQDFKKLLADMKKRANEKNIELAYSEEDIKVLQPLCYNISNDGLSVKDYFKSIKSHKGELVDQITNLSKRLPTLEQNIIKLYEYLNKEEEEQIKDKNIRYKYLVNFSKREIQKGETTTLQVSSEPKKELKVSFKSLNPKVASIDQKGVITALEVGDADIEAAADGQKFKSKVIVIDNKKESEDIETVTNEDDIDWAAKYANAVNKDAVWRTYINTVWVDNLDRIKLIQHAFRAECISYGFDKTNPFFTFIENIYLKYNITADSYDAIHNAVAGNVLKASDLVDGGKELGKLNIIFCKHLYTLGSAVMKMYLGKQNNILKSSVPTGITNKKELAYNILYQTREFTKANSLSDASSIEAKLNSIAKINELELKWLGSSSNINDSKQEPVNTDTFIKNIENTEEATRVLAALAYRFAADNKIGPLVYSYKEVKALMDSTTTGVKIFNLLKNIDSKFKINNITEDKALELIDKILKADKFKFTRG